MRGGRDKEARSFSTFYNRSVSACAQRMDALNAAAGAGDPNGIAALVGHFSGEDAEEGARIFWRSNKVSHLICLLVYSLLRCMTM